MSVCFGQVASFPTPVKHAPVVMLKNVTLLKKMANAFKTTGPSTSSPRQWTRRRSRNQRRVMRWVHSARSTAFSFFPSSSSFFFFYFSCFDKLLSLVFFFLSPPYSVPFCSDFLALGTVERKGEERGQLMEKIWGENSVGILFLLCVLFTKTTSNFQWGLEEKPLIFLITIAVDLLKKLK